MVTGLDEEGGAVVTGLDEGQTGLGSQKEEEEEARALILRSLSCTLAPTGHHVATSGDSDLGGGICGGVPISTSHIAHPLPALLLSRGPNPGHPQPAHFSPLRPPTSCSWPLASLPRLPPAL